MAKKLFICINIALIYVLAGVVYAQEETVVRKDVKYEISNLICSPDGNTYACCARDGDKKLIIAGGEEGRRYSNAMAPVFSPQGHVVYKAIDGAKYFIVDGTSEESRYDETGNPVCAPKGGSVAYWAIFKIPPPPYVKKPLWCMVVNGVWSATNADRTGDMAFGPDGVSLAYASADRADWMLVSGLCAQVKYDSVTDPVFSSDGKSIAYRVEKEQKKFIVLGNVEKTEYGDVGKPVFSPDGKMLAYRANAKKRWSEGGLNAFVVIDEAEGRRYENVGDPVFSPNGKLVAYCAKKDGKWYLVTENTDPKQRKLALEKNEEDLSGSGYAFARDPVFSPDGKIAAFTVENGKKKFVVAVETQGKEYFEISNVVFIDNKTVCYYAYDGTDIFKVVQKLDGK